MPESIILKYHLRIYHFLVITIDVSDIYISKFGNDKVVYNRTLRIIKLIALSLIVLPEPITTVIGLSMLVGTGYLSRNLNARRLKI